MPNMENTGLAIKSRSVLICGLMLLSVMSLLAGPVQASTSNQNDFGTSGGDLPNDLSNPSAIPNIIFSGQITGNGQLIPASDYDYLRVNLGSNEGLAVELSFNVNDDFDISLLDSNGHDIDNSWHSNPEYVSTNGSGYSGYVYIEIMSHTHQPPIYDENYTITIWKFTNQPAPPQNDLATGADLPNQLTSTTNIPNLAFSGTTTVSGQLFPGPDDYDYFSVNLAANEGLAVSLSFDAADDFDLGLWDSPQHNIVVTSYTGANPEYVTTNGSFGTNPQTVYVEICTAHHGGTVNNNNYTVTLWKFSTSTTQPTTNQTDLSIPNYDLPNTQSSLLSDPMWPIAFNGLAPLSSGNEYAELNPNDNYDWLAITIDSYESVAFEVSHNQTSVNNGTTYFNDVVLSLYDANMNLVDYSIGNNPGYVTMNNSGSGAGSHGGVVYVEVARLNGYVDYEIQFWTWIVSTSVTSQNDLGLTNYDLPNSNTALQSDPNFPVSLAGAAPFYSGVNYAELDLNGDNDDWMSFTLNPNDGFAFQITYPTTSSSGVINEFDLFMFDANMNQLDYFHCK